MRLELASNKAIKYSCLNFHYAKSVPVNTFAYSVFNNNDEWCGCVVFGKGANNRIGSEYNLKQGQIIELVRMALNGKQETTSQVLAKAIKKVKQDVPLCKMIVSYADIDQSHKGIIYQATNWYFVGKRLENKTDGSWIIKGKRIHGRRLFDIIKSKGGLKKLSIKEFILKYLDKNATEYVTKGKIKYLYPLCNEMRQLCEKIKKPYSEI